MEFFFSDQTATVMCCFIAGVVMGIVYDLFLIKRRVFGGNTITLCIEDVVFCVISFVLLMLFVLKANYGVIRWYELVLPYLGFAAYRKSIGKVTVNAGSFALKIIIKLARRLFHVFVIIPLGIILKAVRKVGRHTAKLVCILNLKRRTLSKKYGFIKSAGRGFKI